MESNQNNLFTDINLNQNNNIIYEGSIWMKYAIGYLVIIPTHCILYHNNSIY